MLIPRTLCILFLFSLPILRAQTAPPTPATATFEVVSIHPHDPNSRGMSTMMGADSIDAHGMQIGSLLFNTFDISNDDQIIGLPSSLGDARFDIEAKSDPETSAMFDKLSREESTVARRHMMLTMLQDRFHLKAHTEMRELPVYLLQVTKGGTKLKQADPATIPNGGKDKDGHPRGGTIMMRFGSFTGKGVPMPFLALNLQNLSHRIVRDETGLTGQYDFKLEFNQDPMSTSTDTTSPDLFTALQDQLGLKLVPAKASATVVIIDHIEPPTPN